MTNSKRVPSPIAASTAGVGVIGGSIRLKGALQPPARLQARGNRAIESKRAISPSGAGRFGSTELQGALSLAMSPLVTGLFGAFAEGLALYAASMPPKSQYQTQDNERESRP
jgi:hypothetical protein